MATVIADASQDDALQARDKKYFNKKFLSSR